MTHNQRKTCTHSRSDTTIDNCRRKLKGTEVYEHISMLMNASKHPCNGPEDVGTRGEHDKANHELGHRWRMSQVILLNVRKTRLEKGERTNISDVTLGNCRGTE